MLIISEQTAGAAGGEEMVLQNMTPFERLQLLRGKGIETLICGALSPDLLSYAKQLGLQVIHGVAGDIDEVIQAFRTQQLGQSHFWLPGCRGERNYRQGCVTEGAESLQDGQSKRDHQRSVRAGPGGFCICPQCAKKIRHQRGIPCSQFLCPDCRQPMLRE
jgi:predicted Fe-Mo cluster-binding NifX family protein